MMMMMMMIMIVIMMMMVMMMMMMRRRRRGRMMMIVRMEQRPGWTEHVLNINVHQFTCFMTVALLTLEWQGLMANHDMV